VLGLIRLPSIPFLGAFSVGIARKRPRLLRITAPSSNARMICGALLVNQARGVELPVRVVLVAPAVGEPLSQAGARDLPAKLGPEAAAAFRVPLVTARSISRSSACMWAWSE
jgi:hypothetical protein